MIQFDRSDAYDLGNVQVITKPLTGFAENFAAARENAKLNDQSQSRELILKELWDPIVEELNDAFPGQAPVGYSRAGNNFISPGEKLGVGLGVSSTRGTIDQEYDTYSRIILDFMEKNQESLPDHLKGITLESLEQTALDRATAAREYATEIASRGEGFSATLGSFTGSVVGVAPDPANAFGLAFAFKHAPTVWRLAFTEAAIGAGVGAMAEAGVSDWYKKQGLDYTYQDFLKNVSINAVASAGIGVGVKISMDGAKSGYNALFKSGKANKDSEALASLAESAEELEADNPFQNAKQPEAQAEHESRAASAESAVENNNAPAMTDEPTIEPTPEMIQAAADNLDGVMFKIPARDVTIDAKRFQFKEGGDEYGVTERLQGVTEWDPVKAGTVIFWEDAQGKVFIADGHQRAGLARRIMDQKPDQDISLIGYKLRETDDISAEKARVIAAVANIAQGTGTVIDAAKVLRVEPGRISELPPQSVLVRQAKDLVNLTDDAFGAIVNQVIPANYGAIVGRLIDDPELQQAAIKVLSKSDPSNAFQAEAIVRQVRETDMVKETQVSLFGDEDVATSLYTERAKVLDRTVKLLRADKASFENLSRNAERIEAEGNKLAKDQNQRRADQDGQAITLLQALANRKGTLSDDLSAAAREAKDQGYAAAARNFAEAVRRGVERGDFDRAATGDVGRAVDVAPQSRAVAVEDEPTLEGFDEPTGPAAEAQVDQMVLDTFRTLEEVTEIKPVERSLKDRQPVETVDDIFKIAQESQDFIANIGKSLEADLGIKFKNPGLKKIETAKEKMQRKSYASAREMTDISRAGFVINKASDADAIAERLAQNAEILDEGWGVTLAGYFDRKILVRTPNGIVSEVQIWSPKLIEAKNTKGHKLYEQQRMTKDPEEFARLEKEQREIYSKALSEEDPSFAKLVGMEKGPKVLSNVDIKALSSAITRPELRTSRPSTAVQEPPGVSIARASEGEKEIAGRPSQETRKVSDIDDTPTDLLTDITDDIKPEDFDLEIPLGTRFNEKTLENEAVTKTLRDIKSDIDAEDALINRLGVCGL
jgi:hypothetical protein